MWGTSETGPISKTGAGINIGPALAFNPRKTGLPPAIIVDLDQPEAMERLEGYHAVVQNLRLIKGNGINVWAKSDKKWSEAALGMDRAGRVFFIFCQRPTLPCGILSKGSSCWTWA